MFKLLIGRKKYYISLGVLMVGGLFVYFSQTEYVFEAKILEKTFSDSHANIYRVEVSNSANVTPKGWVNGIVKIKTTPDVELQPIRGGGGYIFTTRYNPLSNTYTLTEFSMYMY